jgi:predicted alpha/beta superfamily hydrolase
LGSTTRESPDPRIHADKAPKLGGGRADRYGKFLLEEVMPFVHREYRAEGGPHRTGIGGSSLGGWFRLYLGLTRSDVFGKIAALSPSVWWHYRVIHTFAERMAVSCSTAHLVGHRHTRRAANCGGRREISRRPAFARLAL